MTNKMKIEKTSVLYKARYCAQEEFSIAVCMKGSIKLLEFPFNKNIYKNSKQISPITKWSKVVDCGSNFYVLNESCTFEKYSESSENENTLSPLLDNRSGFCVCSFMQKVYVIGGYIEIQGRIGSSIDSCMCYDIKSDKWTYIASMIKKRKYMSSAVFEGKIVVTGGYSHSTLNSSESYCFHENKWTSFPNMFGARSGHATLAISNKLFVIGGTFFYKCEVFDSITKKFAFVENPTELSSSGFVAVSIAYKVFVFQKCDKEYGEMLILCYNDEKEAWIQESILQLDCKVVKCAKISNK